MKIVHMQDARFGGTVIRWAFVAVQFMSAKMVGMKIESPWTVILMNKVPKPQM